MSQIVIEWDIAGDGSVSKVGVKSSALKNEAVESCIVDKVKALKFLAPPTGNVEHISYPFIFSKNK